MSRLRSGLLSGGLGFLIRDDLAGSHDAVFIRPPLGGNQLGHQEILRDRKTCFDLLNLTHPVGQERLTNSPVDHAAVE